ncbi:MAG: DNA cytosine methyltransferase [Burkholderiales bacterium]
MRRFQASVVDLFCGVGGLTYGFRREGFRVAAGIDTDIRCRYAYERNSSAKFLVADVAKLSASSIRPLFKKGSIRILAGCAPCQPFSLYRNGKKRGERWTLLDAFARLATSVGPEIITMENVPQLVRHAVFKRFVKSLDSAGYWTSWYFAYGPEYGVPQRRKRLIFFASRLGAIEIVPPTHREDEFVTVRDAIGNLPPIRAGEQCKTDKLHRARNLRELNKKRIRATSAGGWWRDWDESLILRCHKKKKGRTYRTVYGRMSWNRPAPTITTQCIGLGNGQFGHPSQHRAISLREAALLQTFPKKYVFESVEKPLSMRSIALHVGNAVPVRLAQIVARSIARHLRLCGEAT